DFEGAVERFSASLPASKGDWWASFKYSGRARSYMGLKKWEAALVDINAAIDHHRRFSVGNTFHCKRVSEMELVKAKILEKLGRTAEAEAEREKAAAPTFEHPRIPFGLYGNDPLLRRLSPH
ncbi:MAG: hypothetical protein ACYS9X_23250, partial [Planctomycetota bacterium]